MDTVKNPATTLASREVKVEQKRLRIEIARNVKGAFMRITETAANGRRNSVVVPATGLGDFFAALNTVAESANGVAPQA
jgi:hypothetical protein